MVAVKIKRHRITHFPRKKRGARFVRAILLWYIPLLILLALIPLAKRFPNAVERFYSRTCYPIIARTYGWLTSLIPFSLLELALLLTVAAVLTAVLYALRCLILRKPALIPPGRCIKWLLRAVSLILSLFMAFCAYNYYRVPFAQVCGLTVRESSANELFYLCLELAGQANELREQLPVDESGVMALSENIFTLSRQSRTVFGGLADNYPTLPDYPITPKPVLSSKIMSHMNITGVFCPVTFESNINMDAPDYTIPATMCHELAHTRGYMREDEANFIAYLACRQSDSVEFQYSGTMLALVHCVNRLYASDRDLFWQYAVCLSEKVQKDFTFNDRYWADFTGPVAKVSTAVNNTYLQMNNQRDGVQSYGRMVDLLLADYRARYELE